MLVLTSVPSAPWPPPPQRLTPTHIALASAYLPDPTALSYFYHKSTGFVLRIQGGWEDSVEAGAVSATSE